MESAIQGALPRLMITGSSGFLGWQLCCQAISKWQVYGLYLNNVPLASHITSIQCDLTHPKQLRSVFSSIAPKAVIHAAAVSTPQLCRQDPDTSFKVNVEATAHLAELCARIKTKLLFVSTDLVFDGYHAPYSEDSPVSPVNIYGKHKAMAEKLVLERLPEAAVCRLPLLFGWAPGPRRNFTLRIIEALADCRPVSLFVDQYRSPLDTHSAARALLKFLNWQGLLHLGGLRRVSRYQMGLLIAAAMGGDTGWLKPISLAECQDQEPQAPDVSLDSSLASRAGFKPLPLEQGLRQTVERFIR